VATRKYDAWHIISQATRTDLLKYHATVTRGRPPVHSARPPGIVGSQGDPPCS
jgi:hypothetical protein